MPPAAMLGIGLGSSALGSMFGASAGNSVKDVALPAPAPVNAGLNNQYLTAISGLLGGTGGSSPGAAGTLGSFINGGYSTLPQWNAMINASQAQVKQGQQNLNEQFGSQGLRFSSTIANADANYQSQVQSQYLSTLAGLQSQSFQQQIGAAQGVMGLASGPGTATYSPWEPVMGQNSVLGAGLGSAGSGLSSIALLSMMGVI